MIDGHRVPPGTVVSVAQWATCRLPAHFHMPNEFHPERWLDDKDTEFTGDCLDASQPFSVGARSCVGRHLADLEARLVMVGLLLNFDMESRRDAPFADRNKSWSMSPEAKSVKSYQSIQRMDFWVNLHDRQAE